MTVTPASLKAANTEFDNSTCTDALAQAKIDAAELELGEDVFGDLYDRAVELLACHYLALMPDGRPMRLDPEMRAGKAGLGVTVYGQALERLKLAVSCGHARVV